MIAYDPKIAVQGTIGAILLTMGLAYGKIFYSGCFINVNYNILWSYGN